jgi:hypothetical protein
VAQEAFLLADTSERMRRNPAGDWTIRDVELICRGDGIDCRPPTRGDHYKVTHPSQVEIVTIPGHRPIKPVYIRLLVKFIERVRSCNESL